ncbi:UTRA domain-containing protein [Telmatospirillum sp. J64-1]|uniref:UTRA domain-containing protein n=1 Tax=Telmatospirillum sp. J64-1 TaxID=2502183 RepID=UPI00115CD195|nr:UTRA domain-containing protein [Telmatospirillum sp. J64-1]
MSDAYYLQLTEHLRELIRDPERLTDGRLPPERLLAERFRTTRMTLRQALAQLEGEGRIHRSNRRGWFVSPERLLYDPTRDAGFNDYVRAQERVPRTEVLAVETRPHPPAAQALGLPASHAFYHIRRRRFVDDRAVLAESLWVVPERAPGLLEHRFDHSLWGLLRKHWQIELAHRSIRMMSEALSRQDAKDLGVTPGTAGLGINRAIFDGERRPVEYDEEHWLHDAICVTVDI